LTLFPKVIEVSCGEYGENNVSALVAAIGNGKHDIREGKPWPEVKDNNQSVALNGDKNGDALNPTFTRTTTNYLPKDSSKNFSIPIIFLI